MAEPRQLSSAAGGADTLTERAASLLQRDILAGQLAPGARLGIVDLARRYEIGATPLREGLSRLVSRGLIVAIGQRGFRVSPVSEDDLRDITRIRTVVEIEALRLAITEGGDSWEAGILAALHRLRRYIERTGARLEACGSPRLLAAHSDFYDQAYRYRRVMMQVVPDGRDFIDSHQRLADRVLARDIAGAQAMLAKHLEATVHFVYPPVPRVSL